MEEQKENKPTFELFETQKGVGKLYDINRFIMNTEEDLKPDDTYIDKKVMSEINIDEQTLLKSDFENMINITEA